MNLSRKPVIPSKKSRSEPDMRSSAGRFIYAAMSVNPYEPKREERGGGSSP